MTSATRGAGARRAAAVAALVMVLAAVSAGLRPPPVRAEEPELSPSAYVFYDAASQGDTAAVRSMLQDTPSLATLKYKNGVTALHAAALADEPATVELLTRRGAFVDARGGTQQVTPLFLAVMKGHARVAGALIAQHADVNAAGSIPGEEGADDLRPLHLAAIGGRADLADLLIQHGAVLSPRSSRGETPAEYAKMNGSLAVSLVLEAYGTLGLVRGRPVAALIRAVSDTDSVAVARLLDRQPALANVSLMGGWSPLHLAATTGSQAVCDALLARHADPRAQETASGWTPALRAQDSGHTALGEYLRRLETTQPATRRAKPR